MTSKVVMPQLGLTMTEGAVSAWLKKPGDLVEKGEMLFMVETDKVEMEVEATTSGYLSGPLLEPRRAVPTGHVIATIVDRAEDVIQGFMAPQGTSSESTAPAPSIQAAPAEGSPDGPVKYGVSPRARKLAEELRVNLSEIVPAQGDRIVEQDVRRVHAARLHPGGPHIAT